MRALPCAVADHSRRAAPTAASHPVVPARTAARHPVVPVRLPAPADRVVPAGRALRLDGAADHLAGVSRTASSSASSR
ncbi:MAG TPA: hypothetical protein VLR26_10615 [Frankiaceae bacterium]|nr:hypothetical protein [Frankiaceae bacterium]